MPETLNDSEIETLRVGAMGSGLLVTVSDRSFFDTFKEAGALAKHVAAAHRNRIARSSGGSRRATARASASRPRSKRSSRARSRRSYVGASFAGEGARRAGGLPGVRARPGSLGPAAAHGGDEAEAAAIAKIEGALGSGGSPAAAGPVDDSSET